MGRVRIGVSGWNYDSWRGGYYPEDLAKKDQLAYLGKRFSTLELNASFYSLRSPDNYWDWAAAVPEGFVFAVKGSRFITHNKKLKDTHLALANFVASGVLALGPRLGPLLWQLPDNQRFDEERLDRFLDSLPRGTEAMAALARDHGEQVEGRSLTETDANHHVRHALEARHESWFVPEAVRVLRRHGVALVVSDAADWPLTEELTAGFVYVRLHGGRRTYASRYTDGDLDHWAARIHRWRDGGEPDDARRITDRVLPRRKSRDVYVYFDNDQQAHAPRDAERLVERLAA